MKRERISGGTVELARNSNEMPAAKKYAVSWSNGRNSRELKTFNEITPATYFAAEYADKHLARLVNRIG